MNLPGAISGKCDKCGTDAVHCPIKFSQIKGEPQICEKCIAEIFFPGRPLELKEKAGTI